MLEILRRTPGLASAVRVRDGSDSLPTKIAGTRLPETAGRFEDPLERRNIELETCKMHVPIQIRKDDEIIEA